MPGLSADRAGVQLREAPPLDVLFRESRYALRNPATDA
jgi:hypothetical protein